MQQTYKKNGPVVIGGIGGSGTRVVAEMLLRFGFYIGDDLNGTARDNLWYTLLFVRRDWYYKNRNNKQTIRTGLSLLSKAMITRRIPSLPELEFLRQAVVPMRGSRSFGLVLRRFKRAWKMLILGSHKELNYVGWGWKEPNSYLLISDMAEYFDNFKYVHVIRHGLDMAFSKNQHQLFRWGPLYGVEIPKSSSDVPVASLQYWVKANQYALRAGKKLGHEKFLLVNFDQLCKSPESEIQKIISFLKISPSRKVYEEALNIPRELKSIGRYRDHNLNQFDSNDLSALQRLGFTI